MQPQRKIMMVETTRAFVNSNKSKLRCQPEAQSFTLKMLCVHHIIQHQYTHAVAVSIAGCSSQIMEATATPNFTGL